MQDTPHRPRVLFVDDDDSLRELLTLELADRGYDVIPVADPEVAIHRLRLRDGAVDVVLTDLRLGGMTGLELCERVVAEHGELPVVLLTGHGTLGDAVAALRFRAFDFLQKPVDVAALSTSLERAVHHRRLAAEVAALGETEEEPEGFEGIIGASPVMRELVQLVSRVAPVEAPVLVRGESGTGKELVARALHERSGRRGPFVALNCAAIPETLLEAELFGHVKGAFTDARADRPGLFERARGGTLFLDEIGELHLALQPKLLRALQERAVRPVGGHEEIPTDVRVVTATNVDLGDAVARRAFREDLYYRLDVIEVNLPPLRERGRDVLLLAQHFLERSARSMHRPVTGMTASCAARLLAHAWPGNVRELANVIERAVALSTAHRLTVDDLPRQVRAAPRPASALIADAAEELVPLEEVEKRYIRRVMAATGGNKTLAAQILGVDRRTLYRKDWSDDAPQARSSPRKEAP